MSARLSREEFLLMQKMINKRCGVLIAEDKAYLIESRLSRLLLDCGAKNFFGLYQMMEKNKKVAQRVIDAITTHETQWFRDGTPWLIMEDLLLPHYVSQLRKGLRKEVRIWSAACSYGQEPYSAAMCIQKYLSKMKIRDVDLSHFKIIATDISETVLEAAQTGRYDGLSVERGLERDYLACFFERRGNHWFIHDSIKGAVEFRRFNLADEYATPGQFDIVFCRYVMIYFSEEAKRTLIKKISSSLNPGGVMFLGNSEILNIETGKFEQLNYNTGIFFRIRR